MGLLDQFDAALNSDKGMQALGLLAAAGPSATPMSFGQRLYGAMQQDRQRKAEEDAMKQRKMMQELQMQALMSQAQERKRAQEQAMQTQTRQAAFQQALGGPSGAEQALAGGGGPTPANAAKMGQVQAPDWRALALKFPDQIELIKKLSESNNFGRTKVARVEETMDGGRPVKRQFDEYGAPVGDVLPQWKAPVMSDAGGAINAIDPVSLQVLNAFKKTNTPDSLLSAQTAMRGQNMADARAREGNQISATNGKIPPGYRMRADGNLEAIPGGPADIKAGEIGVKAEQRRKMAESSANSVIGTVKEAKDLVGINTAGVGSWMASLPATDARNLAAKLETIKANLGFDRLQQMREASPTGGALGAVAVQELTALQSTVSSLDQAQSPAQLKTSLDKIERHYQKWLGTVQGGKTGGPQPGTVEGGYRFKGGDAGNPANWEKL